MDENQTTAPQKSNGAIIVSVLVVILIVAGVFWFTNQKKTTDEKMGRTQVTATQEPTLASESPEQVMSKELTVEGGSFYFKPKELRVKEGDKVKITFTSVGGMHDFVIDEFNVRSETIDSGSTTVEFTADKKGTFEFYCSVGNHRKMGMKGNLIVE